MKDKRSKKPAKKHSQKRARQGPTTVLAEWATLRQALDAGEATPEQQRQVMRVLAEMDRARALQAARSGNRDLPPLQGDTLRDQLLNLEYEILFTYRREMTKNTGIASVHAADRVRQWCDALGVGDDQREQYAIELVPIARQENGAFVIISATQEKTSQCLPLSIGVKSNGDDA
jgi:hypothetical protein